MKILIYPEDILRRCLWDTFTYYIVGSEKEAEKILKENKEFEISERDAIVIGLLKVMQTDNLIHRFNDYFIHFLTVRSLKEKDNFLIKRKSVETSIEKFMEKFPHYWEPNLVYKQSLKDLIEYTEDLKSKISKLDIIKMTIQNVSYEFYNTSAVKKLLNFNNY